MVGRREGGWLGGWEDGGEKGERGKEGKWEGGVDRREEGRGDREGGNGISYSMLNLAVSFLELKNYMQPQPRCLQVGTKLQRLPNIPSYLPSFPDPHTYIKTAVSVSIHCLVYYMVTSVDYVCLRYNKCVIGGVLWLKNYAVWPAKEVKAISQLVFYFLG